VIVDVIEPETPKRRRRSTADWDRGRAAYPGVDDPADAWVKAFVEQPDVLWTMIADVVKVAKATDGPKRTGRRPAITGLSVDDVWATLYPEHYTTEPFGVAVSTLLGERSHRQLVHVMRLPCSQPTFSRMMNGGVLPKHLPVIEAVAAALKVPPTYFREYRSFKLAEVVSAVLLQNPQMSIGLVKKLRGLT
jgi:hypothetical protein